MQAAIDKVEPDSKATGGPKFAIVPSKCRTKCIQRCSNSQQYGLPCTHLIELWVAANKSLPSHVIHP